MSRWTASGIHLLISAGIALLFVTLMLLIWYPQPYFRASGANQLLTILIGVDVVIGPLLTLVVFKSGKKTLKFDLGVIGFLQIAALIYGASIVWQARPVFLVFAVDRFVLVAANELSDEDLSQAEFPQFKSLPWTGPRVVGTKLPTTTQERKQLLFSSVFEQKDIDRMPKYYIPFEEQDRDLHDRVIPLDKLLSRDVETRDLIMRALHKAGRKEDQVGYLPLLARKFDMAMLVVKTSGVPLTAVHVDPW